MTATHTNLMATTIPSPAPSPTPPPSPSGVSLDACVAQAAVRVRVHRALVFGATGLCAGVLPSLAAVAGFRLSLCSDAFFIAEPYLLLPPLIGAAAGAIYGATRVVSRPAVARRLDDALGLEDRFSSAVAFADNFSGDDTLRDLQARDAETFARDLGRRPHELRVAVPLFPLPFRAWAGLAGVALVIGLSLAPSLSHSRSVAKPDTKAEQAQVKKEGERLLRLARTLEARDRSRGGAAPGGASDAQRAAAARMAKLGDEMKRGKLTRREAMMKTAKLSDEVKQTQRALASARGAGANEKSLLTAGRELEKAMQEAAKQTPQASPANGLNNAPLPGKSASSSAGKPSPAQQRLNNAQKALAQNDAPALSQQLRKLADDMAAQGAPQNATEREKTARQVDALGDSLNKTRLSDASKSLKEAAKAARSGDNKTASDKMHEAAAKIEEAERKAGDAQAMQDAADAMQNNANEQNQAAPGEAQQAAEQAASQVGRGQNDAFGADGKIKRTPGGSGEGTGKNGKNGSGKGEGKGTGNGIGTGAGTPGGAKRPVGAAGPYQDPKGAKAGAGKEKAGRKLVRNAKFTRLYAPEGQMPTTSVKGKRGDAGRESVTTFRGAPDKNAKSSSVPYYEVYGKYAPAAESAQRREDLPAPYKKQVKDYFDALRPDANGGPAAAPSQRKP